MVEYFFQIYVLVITKYMQCSHRILNSSGSVPLRFGALHNMGIIDVVNPVLLGKAKWINLVTVGLGGKGKRPQKLKQMTNASCT